MGLYVIDRIKDIINAYKGYSIDPRDIEEVLYSHPKVGQAACVGIPHECGAGELITAWVVPKEGETLTREEVREHCKVLAEFQQPNTFEISYKKLPEVGGKISKKLIRSSTWVRAGLGDRLEDSAIAKKASAAQALLVPFTVVVVPVEHIFVNNVCQLRTV